MLSSCNSNDFFSDDQLTPFELTPAVTPFPLSGGNESEAEDESVASFTLDVFE